ncbi:Non-selective cation channel, putative [Cryptococcus gattii WM276]|uniref:Non-selective cation channel, putative n=1 Tax=Cryptococcus gattii serotype B (strain WM276 / ATCC MYA-4071) TaxID=367775 RepID=E6QZJ4_CRYGW|nr:Non-selective cation channel, putative [Cryptococcus gattii WM276]ADV19593.1 Non-selective cation channel, putative [Cryptococcus gattii WM276]
MSSSGSAPATPVPQPLPDTVFPLIHEIHAIVTQTIDTALDWDQLNSPPINYSLVRPIVQRLAPKIEHQHPNGTGLTEATALDAGELGVGTAARPVHHGPSLGEVLYALMANRIQFITLSASDLSSAPLQTSRAAFCELLAIKVLRSQPYAQDEAALVGQLVHAYCAFEGASDETWASLGEDKKDVEEMNSSALELAIVSSSKNFLSLPLIQHLVNLIYSGQLIYSPMSSRSIISDSYISERTRQRRRRQAHDQSGTFVHSHAHTNDDEELREVYVYNPYQAGWLDHSRLKVPKWRKCMEFMSFIILLALFVSTLAWRDLHHLTVLEIIYIFFSFGFILDEFAASKEHGWAASHSTKTSDLAFDILACAACITFPRLVFFVIRENVVILALRGMVASFVSFMTVTILAFTGICFCLWTLGRATWTVKQIVWLMAQIWFGSSYLGFSASESFHPIFGPIVLISYAALCNVLLITMLIAILSNKFAAINQNAQREHLFQRVVKTVEGVKTDALFSYLPPINILAFAILVPLSWTVSPRTLHRINVFAIRLTSFPILIAISAYERYSYQAKQRAIHLGASTMDGFMDVQRASLLNSWLGGGSEFLIASAFEVGPPVIFSRPNQGGSTSESEMPPKAATIGPLVEDEGDGREAAATTTTTFGATPIPKAVKKGKDKKKNKSNDSPLAKLFGRPAFSASPEETITILKDRGTNKGKQVKMVEQTVSEKEGDVEQLKKEIELMRQSQLRMEEMLAGFLAGKSA